MKIKIIDHAENTARVIEYPFTVSQFVKIHWGAWAYYRIEKAGPTTYNIFSGFDDSHLYTVSKARASDPVTE